MTFGQIFLIGSFSISFGPLCFASEDIPCTFKSAKTNFIIKNYDHCGGLIGEPFPNLEVARTEDGNAPEILKTRGNCSYAGHDMWFIVTRAGKEDLIKISRCEKSADSLKATLVVNYDNLSDEETKSTKLEGSCKSKLIDESKAKWCSVK